LSEPEGAPAEQGGTLAGQDSEAPKLTPFAVIQMRARKGKIAKIVFAIAMFAAFLEIFYVMNFYTTLAQFVEALGFVNLARAISAGLHIPATSVYGLVMASLVAVGFLVFPAKRPGLQASESELKEFMKKYVERIPKYDYVLAALAFIVFGFQALLAPYVEANEGALPETINLGVEVQAFIPALIIAIIGFILVFELTRRAVGPWLVLVASVFLAYYFYYNLANTLLGPTGVLKKWIQDMYYSTSGLFNIPFQVMAAYVFAFLFFGTFLERIGIGEYITRLMLAFFGGRPGGPAKVAIVSSGFMGMLSGSSVANVFTTGVFTIPLMKKSGFPPEVAGAIEASASTGGQIMPPIMGAAAFIMASFIGRPYGDIVIAAFVPAFIYFASLYYFVDLEAKRLGLRGLSKEELPPKGPLLRKIYLLSPIILITALLVKRLPPQHSVVASLSVALVAALWAMDKPLSTKIAYTLSLIIIGLVAKLVGMNLLAAVYFTGIAFLFITMGLIITKSYKEISKTVFASIEQAVRNSIPVFMAAALAGVVQGSLTLTGLSTRLGEYLINIARGNIYLLLVFAGFLSILVGMGVPTTANYVITSLLSASAIVAAATNMLGLPEAAAILGAHMFVFYYGILADLTPPVALAAFAGATVARADFWKTAVNATRFGFAKYVLPFVFAVNPAMLLIPVLEGYMTWWDFAWSIITIVAVIVAASAGFAGYLAGHIKNKIVRAVLAIAGILAVSGLLPLVALAYAVTLAVAFYNMTKKK